jgi:hypothetical protein
MMRAVQNRPRALTSTCSGLEMRGYSSEIDPATSAPLDPAHPVWGAAC